MTLTDPPRTLLIVDDNVTNLKVAVEHLRAYSFTLLTAATGAAGLERAQLAQPDLILLDIKLPDLDGVEACRRLKANPATRAIPVIFMTALADAADRVRGLEAGAVDYLTKPVEAAELLARVRTHLALRDLQLRLEARVQERTAALEAEAAERRRAHDEKDRLLDLLRQQSDQLRALTQRLLDGQTQRDHDLAQALTSQITDALTRLAARLTPVQQWLAAQAGTDPALQAAQAHSTQAQADLAALRQAAERLAAGLDSPLPSQPPLTDSPLFRLTTREYEVLQLILRGKSHAEIAALLGVARPTVGTYRARLMHKLGVADLPALMQFAVQHRLLP